MTRLTSVYQYWYEEKEELIDKYPEELIQTQLYLINKFLEDLDYIREKEE